MFLASPGLASGFLIMEPPGKHSAVKVPVAQTPLAASHLPSSAAGKAHVTAGLLKPLCEREDASSPAGAMVEGAGLWPLWEERGATLFGGLSLGTKHLPSAHAGMFGTLE